MRPARKAGVLFARAGSALRISKILGNAPRNWRRLIGQLFEGLEAWRPKRRIISGRRVDAAPFRADGIACIEW